MGRILRPFVKVSVAGWRLRPVASLRAAGSLLVPLAMIVSCLSTAAGAATSSKVGGSGVEGADQERVRQISMESAAAGLLRGFETLEDPEDRLLPASREYSVLRIGGAGGLGGGSEERMAAAVLGADGEHERGAGEPKGGDRIGADGMGGARAAAATRGTRDEGDRPAGERESEARAAAAVRAVLGPDWRLERAADAGGGGLVRLRGPAVTLPGGATPDAVRVLVLSLPEAFGPPAAGSDLELAFDRSSAPSRSLRLQQVHEGAIVLGAGVRAHFDASGRLASLASSLLSDLDLTRLSNRRLATRGDAVALARADLVAAQPGIEIRGEPSATAWVWPLPEGRGHAWIVRQATRRPWGSFVTLIDAGTGVVVWRENLADHAVERVGKGRVFKTNAAYPTLPTMGRLPSLQGAAENPLGLLAGTHVVVEDDKDSPVAAADLVYGYYPFEQRDSFDQVSAYFHVERARAHFARKLRVEGVDWFDRRGAIRARVNVEELCDAFYSPDLSGDGVPGIALGDQHSCLNWNDDFARDSDVIYHEYTHGIVDWMGHGLGLAPINSYQRALNEAVADYHAASLTGDPVLGEVVGISRNLRNAKIYPDDVGCSYGRPQEHCTGEIWGGLLWDLRLLFPRRAERLAFASLDYLSDNWPSGHVETWIDFWDAALALLDADRALNDGGRFGLIYGAAASRGVFGLRPYSTDGMSIVYPALERGTRFKSVGWIHKPAASVPYYFTAPADATVKIKVRSTSGVKPVFLLGDGLGIPFEYFAASVAQPDGEALLETTLPETPGVYVLRVQGAESTTGSFQVSIVIR